MKTKIKYKELKSSELSIELFADFNRYQEVNRCWRHENNKWVLKNIAFIEKWDSEDYINLLHYLIHTLKSEGVVFGAFEMNQLVGFFSVESQSLGKKREYVQLSSLHVSFENRGHGIGRNLFELSCEEAKRLGAKKLYISAHSSEETQAFYKKMGCMEASEYIEKIAKEEPHDCQLEFIL